MKTIRIGLLGAEPWGLNKGCEALTFALVKLLDQYSKNNDQALELSIIHSSIRDIKDISFKYPDKEITVKGIPVLYNLSSIERIKNIVKPGRINNQVLKYYKSLDFVMEMSYGDSFSDIYGKERYLEINRMHELFKSLNVKLVFLPQTLGPFDTDECLKKAIASLEYASFVMPRDLLSLEFVKENTRQEKLAEIIDVAFFLPFKQRVFSNEFIHVGLNISDLLWRNGYTGKNEFNLKVDYKQLNYDIINYFMSLPNIRVHLVPHVIGGAKDGWDDDYELAIKLQKELNYKVEVSPFFYSAIDAKNYISGMDFFMGARMHATIAAFSSGVPVVPLAYSRKFNGLYTETLNYNYVGDMKADSIEIILGKIKSTFEAKAEVKAIIEDRLNSIVLERESRFFEVLKSIS